MDGVPIHGHGRLAHNLREAWVGVDGHTYLLRCSFDELSEDPLGYEVCDLRSYHVHPQDEVSLRIGDHLYKAVRLALDEGLADRPKGERGLLNLVTFFL